MSDDFSFHGICGSCNRKKYFVRKRDIRIPTKAVAISKKKLCGQCYKKIQSVLESI